MGWCCPGCRGDHSLLKALDDVHLAPGFAYSEREVGTNGLGLALADRVPTLVRADQHYSLSLCTFTCAAVPVFDPASGRLEGSVNLTTWSRSSSDLLLALARSAASNTTALMLARSNGRLPRPTPRGQVFRVEVPRLEPGSGTLHALSEAWNAAVARAERAMADGAIVAAVGEAGCGPGDAARPSRAPHLSARPHPVGQCARADRRPDVAGAVDARTRQVAHRGDRPRRRPAAGRGSPNGCATWCCAARERLPCRSR